MRKIAVLYLGLIMIPFFTFSQSFEQKSFDIGNIGVTLSNVGTIGQPNIRNNPSGPPSMEYPMNSGIEHLFEGGLWIGANVNGQTRVSTASIDAPYGYFAGGNGFEFTALGSISSKSSQPSSDFYSATAIAHQQYYCLITDSNNVVPGTSIPIANHDFPLKAVVEINAYAWNYSFADFFVIFDYQITNYSNEDWDSVYFGIWTDMVVRNVNVTQDAGSAFYNKGGGGFVDSFDAIYAFQVNGDDIDYTQSYGALQFLGIEWRDLYYHPNNWKLKADSGYHINVNGNFWNFRTFDGSKFGAPEDDLQRYAKMKTGLQFPDPALDAPSNKTQLLSVGPVPEIKTGETVNFVMAVVAAKQLKYMTNDEASREELNEHLNWSKRTYIGEDLNENGLLDQGEDLNANNELDRYILPEPPLSPKVKIVSSNQKVDIYWDDTPIHSIDPISKKHDFEGFKLYRTKVGDDLNLNLSSSAKLIASWDSVGNDIGFNNGFEAIRLQQAVTFEDDPTEYVYHYSMDGLLNGWQYMIILTAFDEGDKELDLEPLESSKVENSYSVFIGSAADDSGTQEIGVYPNPYRSSASWDGVTSRTKKIYFYNLPSKCEIIIYTLSGDVVTRLDHDADFYNGDDIQWFPNFSGSDQRVFSGGEHAWDLLSDNGQSITQGLYLFSVKDLKGNTVKTGKFAVLK
ncbi:MAG: hypothetical protein HOG05_02815 [Bacteroidetes bacterium]|nr:hypothetical protein [Bacteroidota bacterium]MBT6835502.1 hypothetical protein [Bacteroidota bacterium]